MINININTNFIKIVIFKKKLSKYCFFYYDVTEQHLVSKKNIYIYIGLLIELFFNLINFINVYHDK